MSQSQVASILPVGYRASERGAGMDDNWTKLTVYERIRAALGRTDRDQVDLAKALGIDPSVISKALKKESGLEKHLPRIAEFFRCSLDWLVKGEGHPPIINPKTIPASVKDTMATAHQLEGRRITIPIIGEVTAGHGESWIDDDGEDGEYLLDRSVALVRVHGGSGGSVIREGQMALLAPTDRKPKSGDIVAVQTTDKQSYVKRLSIDSRHKRLILTNVDPSAEGESLTLDEGEVGILRVVIGCIYE